MVRKEAIYCKTEEEYFKLLKVVYEKGYYWNGMGDKRIEKGRFKNYRNNFILFLNNGDNRTNSISYADVKCAKEQNLIINTVENYILQNE